MGRITVYIPVYKHVRYLREALESVLRQSIPEWNLVVVDNLPDPAVEQVAGIYLSDPRVSLLRLPGASLQKVANTVLHGTQSEYILRLDPDDILNENIFLVLGDYLDRHPDCAIAYSDYYMIDDEGHVFAQERLARPYEDSHIDGHAVNGACSLIRRAALLEVGGYREDLRAQDGYDIWSRLRSSYRCQNVSIPLFYYRRHDANLTNNTQRILEARREVRRAAAAASLDDARPVVAVIPCRRHYDFVTDLWKQDLAGASLLRRAINTALASDLFDHVVVSSDTEEVLDVIDACGDPRLRWVARSREMTYPSQSFAASLGPVMSALDLPVTASFVINYINTPFKTTGTLEESFYAMAMNDGDSALGVEEVTGRILRRSRNGLEPVNDPSAVRSEAGQLYREGMLTAATRSRNIRTGSLLGARIIDYLVDPSETLAINSQRDLEMARLLAPMLLREGVLA